jgi:hypothetical protein
MRRPQPHRPIGILYELRDVSAQRVNEQDIAYIRAPSTDSIAEKAQRAAEKIVTSDYYLMMSPSVKHQLRSQAIEHFTNLILSELRAVK